MRLFDGRLCFDSDFFTLTWGSTLVFDVVDGTSAFTVLTLGDVDFGVTGDLNVEFDVVGVESRLLSAGGVSIIPLIQFFSHCYLVNKQPSLTQMGLKPSVDNTNWEFHSGFGYCFACTWALDSLFSGDLYLRHAFSTRSFLLVDLDLFSGTAVTVFLEDNLLAAIGVGAVLLDADVDLLFLGTAAGEGGGEGRVLFFVTFPSDARSFWR